MALTPFSISIDNEEDMKLIKAAFEHKINECSAAIQRLEKEIRSLETISKTYKDKIRQMDVQITDPAVHQLAVNEITVPIPNEAPPAPKIKEEIFTGMTKAAQAEYVLKHFGKPASTREILEFLLKKDPALLKKNNTTFDKYQKALAATLYQKAAVRNTFHSARDGNTDTVKYSLVEWAGG